MYTIIPHSSEKSSLPGTSPLSKMQLLITCQAGLESLVKRDSEKHGGTILSVTDRIVRVSADEETLYNLLIWSRYANRIYIELARESITDFDALFELVTSINWRHHIRKDSRVVTEAISHKSLLTHVPTLQSIMKKAIVTHLTEKSGSAHLYEREDGNEIHVQLFLLENLAHIALDITGIPLHRRGYRAEAGDAPIKENLAAALVVLSGWKYKTPLYDPFCGSGTIAIEAAMIARNIAPGQRRSFALENHPYFEKNLFEKVKSQAKQKMYPSGEYAVFASDIDARLGVKAKNNAIRAGVAEDITFFAQDFLGNDEDLRGITLFKNRDTPLPYTLITNPPYGDRLETPVLSEIYEKLAQKFNEPHISGGIITNNEIWESLIHKKDWKDRKLYNGGLPARYWIKNPPK